MQKLKIDPELRDLLPPLTNEEYKQLEKNIVENGFDKNFPIMVWHDFIVDGHNRYEICEKHGIDFVYGNLGYETKEEVMEWMLDIQLGRRNLSPIQRIAVAEKYRSLYEKQARERQGTRTDLKDNFVPNLAQSKPDNRVNTKLAEVAGVGKETYRMGAKILNSDNEEVKNAVLSGEMSINAGYNKIRENKKVEDNNTITLTTTQTTTTIPNNSIKEPSKPIVENGVILIEEKTDDDKMMNEIARRMKSGQADLSKISNELELNNIKEIIGNNIDSAIAYVRSNLNFDEFNSSDLQKLREIVNEAKNKMEILMKDMEELINE